MKENVRGCFFSEHSVYLTSTSYVFPDTNTKQMQMGRVKNESNFPEIRLLLMIIIMV